MELEEKKSILLTFDVEDWFQVENFKAHIKFSAWNFFELRVEKNTHKILDILDSFSIRPKATFFILGWIADKLPSLVREIHDRGHEVASHGYNHQLCQRQNKEELFKDLSTSKKLLEDLIGHEVTGFRAPSFSINDVAINSIQKAGYEYDSSFNSFSGHGRYGTMDLSKSERTGVLHKINDQFFELPISNLKLLNRVIPLGGGGYFRLIPFYLFKCGMRFMLKRENAFVFYAHPWEFDPGQPKVEDASRGFKFRHYVNLPKTESKLKKLLAGFRHCDFITCREYIRIKSI